jgi:hypothetical protein
MQILFFRKLLILTLTLISFGLSAPASAASRFTSCTMTYKLSGWSFVYKQYGGTGNITCSNGQQAHVKLASKSVGFTIGRSEIDGFGTFTDVKDINEIYGVFVALEGHAGANKSADGQVLTRGIISLTMSGLGRGFDIGVTLGGLRISPLR